MAPLVLAVWQGKPSAAQGVDWALTELEQAALTAAANGAHLLVLPELFLGGYRKLRESASLAVRVGASHVLSQVCDTARTNKIAIVLGFYERGADDEIYNSVMAVDADGSVKCVYRKTHLFGEAECAAFKPGDELGPVFSLCGVRCGLLICYDVEFPEATRTLALGGASLVLVPTANFFPYSFVNDPLVRVRAYESHVHVVYANWAEHTNEDGVHFNGLTVAASPQGEKLLALSPSDEGLFYARLEGVQAGGGPVDGHEDDYLGDRRPELYAMTGPLRAPVVDVERRVLQGLVAALALACTALVVARRR